MGKLGFLPWCVRLDYVDVVQSLNCLALINNPQSLKLPKNFSFVTSCYSVKNACNTRFLARQGNTNQTNK